MLSMDVNMPVTLVVKAPNQKFGDLTVECGLGWTIRKLKEHLAKVYPNKPVSRLDKEQEAVLDATAGAMFQTAAGRRVSSCVHDLSAGLCLS